jgi:hypothetical protein
VSATALIERAFAAKRVDEFIMGDWEDVQIELGLKTKRDKPQQPLDILRFWGASHSPHD